MFHKMLGELFSAITEGILVRVRTEFHKKHSQNGNFVFTYYKGIFILYYNIRLVPAAIAS